LHLRFLFFLAIAFQAHLQMLGLSPMVTPRSLSTSVAQDSLSLSPLLTPIKKVREHVVRSHDSRPAASLSAAAAAHGF